MREPFEDPAPSALYDTLARSGLIERLFEIARDEDLGDTGDLTSRSWFESDDPFEAHVVAREPGVLAGLACVGTICDVFARSLAGAVACEPLIDDGASIAPGARLCTLIGPRSAVVGVERTILNTIGRLSGVATLTSKYVESARAGNPRVRVLDTRKTTPGLRALEKYAVRCGGGSCHRMGLWDAALVKDNHVAGMSDGSLRERVGRASVRARELGASFVEIEVDSLDQLRALLGLDSGVVDIVLLDNMTNGALREAVGMRDASNRALRLEASGGVKLDTIEGIAGTGVERISVGALTHSAVSLDVGLDTPDPARGA